MTDKSEVTRPLVEKKADAEEKKKPAKPAERT